MNVYVIEKNSGKCIATYPVVVSNIKSQTTENDFFDEAWQCAVEDKIAKSDEKEKYTFSFEI